MRIEALEETELKISFGNKQLPSYTEVNVSILPLSALPEKLRKAAVEFCQKNSYYSIPKYADGACVEATNAFYGLLMRKGFRTEELDFLQTVSRWQWKGYLHPWDETLGVLEKDYGSPVPHLYYYDNGWPGHVCACVSLQVDEYSVSYYLDFTARQYDPNAPFPLIWMDVYEYVSRESLSILRKVSLLDNTENE